MNRTGCSAIRDVLAILGCVSVSVLSFATLRDIHNGVTERADLERRASTWVTSTRIDRPRQVLPDDDGTEQSITFNAPMSESVAPSDQQPALIDAEELAGLRPMPDEKSPAYCAS